ncbi:MAG: MFS transporter [Chloroflexota bacterium]|nr:MFS transporter [Chloroflexota bacterium]
MPKDTTMPGDAPWGGRFGVSSPLVALLAANAVSQVGNTLTHVAILWFVLETSGSAARAGLAALLMALPFVVAGLLGGALVDRLGYKRTSVLSDLASGLTVALIPLLHHTAGLAFWQLLALVFLGALLDAPGEAARQSLVPDLARAGGVGLERVNGANEAIRRLALLLGPPFAGGLIAALGPSTALVIDAVTFALSAALVVAVIPGAPAVGERRAATRYRDEVVEGLRFIVGAPTVRALIVTLSIAYAIGTPLIAVVLPVYVRNASGSAAELGLVLAGFGAGSLLGTLAFGWVGHRLPRRPTLSVALLLAGMPLFVLAATPPLAGTVAALAFRGLAFGPVTPLAMTVLQEQIPADLRGRTFATQMAFSAAVVAVGMGLAGVLIDAVGLRGTLLGMGTVYVAVALSPLVTPAVRTAAPQQASDVVRPSGEPPGA